MFILEKDYAFVGGVKKLKEITILGKVFRFVIYADKEIEFDLLFLKLNERCSDTKRLHPNCGVDQVLCFVIFDLLQENVTKGDDKEEVATGLKKILSILS